MSKKAISSLLFAILIACFFLPFVTFSLLGNVSFKAINFVIGLDGSGIDTGSFYIFIVLLLINIVGFLLYFIKNRKSDLISFILGVAGLIILLIIRFRISSMILSEGYGLVKASYTIGFYAMAIGYLLIILISGSQMKIKHD